MINVSFFVKLWNALNCLSTEFARGWFSLIVLAKISTFCQHQDLRAAFSFLMHTYPVYCVFFCVLYSVKTEECFQFFIGQGLFLISFGPIPDFSFTTLFIFSAELKIIFVGVTFIFNAFNFAIMLLHPLFVCCKCFSAPYSSHEHFYVVLAVEIFNAYLLKFIV